MNVRWAWLWLGAVLLSGGACDRKSGDPSPATGLAVQVIADADLQGPDLFEDATKASGIDFTYRNGEATGAVPGRLVRGQRPIARLAAE